MTWFNWFVARLSGNYRICAVVYFLFLSLVLVACGGGGGDTGGVGTGDTTPPAVVSTSPANEATGVVINSTIMVTFSEPMDSSTINNSTFSVNNGSSNISGSVSCSGATAIFSPSTSLSISTLYTVTITTGGKDIAWNALSANYNGSFTTSAVEDTSPPTVTSTIPAKNQTAVPVSSTVSATFSETINPSTLNTTTFTLKAGSTSVPGTVGLTGNTATFTPSTALSSNATYTATITTGVKDLAGNSTTNNYEWNFTTSSGPTSGILDNNWKWALKSNQTLIFNEIISGIQYQNTTWYVGQETLNTIYGLVTTTKNSSITYWYGGTNKYTQWFGVANNKLIQFKEDNNGTIINGDVIFVDFPAYQGKTWAAGYYPNYGNMTATVVSTNVTLTLPIGTITGVTRIHFAGTTGGWCDQYYHPNYPYSIKTTWSAPALNETQELKEIIN